MVVAGALEVGVAQSQYDVRSELLKDLLGRVQREPFPSGTTLDAIEELLTPDDVARYAQVLLSKVGDERFPSVTMLRRIRNLAR